MPVPSPHPALGFVASTAAVAAYGLSTDPPVEAVPPRRCLQIYLKDQRIQPLNDDSRPASGYTTRSQQHMALIRRLLEAHNLKPAPEPYYVIKLLQLRGKRCPHQLSHPKGAAGLRIMKQPRQGGAAFIS